MTAQSCSTKTKAAPPQKPLAWWKKLLIGLFGTYLAAKFFGSLVPDISTAALSSPIDKGSQTQAPDHPTDEYPNDTWDYPPEENGYEDRYHYEGDEPVDDPLYDDEDDWNEGYNDDHFN